MTSEEQQLFHSIDDYCRKHHQCFVAEMFLNKASTEYTGCFRPLNAEKDSLNRYACRYLHLATDKIYMVEQTNVLVPSVKEMLDRELADLGH